MTDKQPNPLALAAEVDEVAKTFPDMAEVSACIRTQHAEIERLTSCLKWEQNRADRIGTHGPGCEKWGPAHFECALRAIERKDALLRQALEALEFDMSKFAFSAYYAAREEAVGAITKELSQ